MSQIDAAEHYRRSVERVIALIDDHGSDAIDAPVRACPGWSVGDVLRHVVGLTSDVVRSHVDGYAGPEWTENQIAQRRGMTWPALRAEWLADLPAMVAINRDLAGSSLPEMIEHVMGPVPKVAFEQAFTVDLVQHELDVRAALGAPRTVDTDTDQLVASAQISTLRGVFAVSELPTVHLVARDVGRTWPIGRNEPVAMLHVSLFELLRTIGGRRTVDEIRNSSWSGDPSSVVEYLVVPFFSAPASSLGERA
ncbi:MAG: maleylpyruvate isomerase family mycothiol-dependent enzyme [Actinomycetota bacterium]